TGGRPGRFTRHGHPSAPTAIHDRRRHVVLTSDFSVHVQDYSIRKATAGSTRIALHAGATQATTAAPASTAAVPANVIGSSGVTSYSNVPRNRVSAAATARPIATPPAVILIAPPTTSRRTPCAPPPRAPRRAN